MSFSLPYRYLVLLTIFLFSCMTDADMLEEPRPWDYEENQVQTADSGLKFVIHQEGSGNKPDSGLTVSVHYSAYYENRIMFDSTLPSDEPFLFIVGINQVIKGFDEGVLDMREGEKRTLIIPPNLAYGASGRPPVIPANATLIFDVELLSISTE